MADKAPKRRGLAGWHIPVMADSDARSTGGLHHAMNRLRDVIAKRRLSRPGTRDYRTLPEEEGRLTDDVAILSRPERSRDEPMSGN